MKKQFLLLFISAALVFSSCDPRGDTYYHVINNSGHDLTMNGDLIDRAYDTTLWHIAAGDTCCLGSSFEVGYCFTVPSTMLGFDSVCIVFDDSSFICYPYVPYVPNDSTTPDGRNIYSAGNWKDCPRNADDHGNATLVDTYYTVTEEDYRRAKETL